MFKKDRDLAERSRSLLKNKETKKLKEVFLTKFPRLTESELDTLVGKEQFTRIYLATKTIIYSVGDVPLFIDVEGRNNIIPTVQCLWRLPRLLRTFVIHAPVSEFVMNGADLMLPGLATVDGLEGVMRDEKMSIRVIGNPLPFAVGISNCSWEGILTNGRKGKALCVTSVYGDCLCSLKAAPNSGFGGSSIYALEGYQEVTENSDDDDNDDDEKEGGVSYKRALKNKDSSGGSRIGGSSGIISRRDASAASTLATSTTTTASSIVLPAAATEDLEDWEVVDGNEDNADNEDIVKNNDIDDKDEDEDGNDGNDVENDSDSDPVEDDDELTVTPLSLTTPTTKTATTTTSSSSASSSLQSMQAMDALMLTALLRAIKYVIKVG